MRSHTSSSLFGSIPSSLLSLSTISTLLLTFSSPSVAYDCADFAASKKHYDFHKLGGPRVLHWEDQAENEMLQFNYTFTLDICKQLKHKKGSCPPSTLICAERETIDLTGDKNNTIQAIPIAGFWKSLSRPIHEQFQLLRDSSSNADVDRDGIRAELHGGQFPWDNSKGMDQRAIIEFVCDKKRTGLDDGEEGDGKGDGNDGKDGDDDNDKDEKDESATLRRRNVGKCEDTDKDLRFCGFEAEKGPKDKKVRTLRLEWRTKYACDDVEDDNETPSWGFFTWFIIILFLATAAYLIFGSWLNYNRYGARGWDLLPHGDTIRDVPYILKDCARRVKDTFQGPGSRGGYSAV